MNEGRDVWSGGNLSEKGAQVNKSLRRGLDIHKGMELFPKKPKPSEIDQTLEGLQEAQDYVEKERRLRRVGGPFVGSPLVEKEGTSEGAKKGWETRREGGAGAEEEKPTYKKYAEHAQARASEFITRATDAISKIDTSSFNGEEKAKLDAAAKAIDNVKGILTSALQAPDESKMHNRLFMAREEADAARKFFDPTESGSLYRKVRGSPVINAAAGIYNEIDAVVRSSKVKKTVDDSRQGLISKDQIEKILKDAGWDKLPLPDKAKEVLEDLVSNGARPVSEYTGKLMIEHGIAEEPPAFVRPKKLEVGDTVVPIDWRSVGAFGAKFDMPNVPPAAKIKKIYMGPAKVTKNAYPFGRMPSDLSKVETVTEERMWGLDLEGDKVGKDDDTFPSTYPTRDTTMVLRMEALASPEGEVNPGLAPPR